MAHLSIFPESGEGAVSILADAEGISASLQEIGVQFEQWQATEVLSADALQEEVLVAYEDSVKRLTEQYQFESVDVVSLNPEHPQKDELRQKFLQEHTHADFEVRFFVEGKGLFYLHVNEKVYMVFCEQGDLISVPANTTHWFDMGESPEFKCIRFFTQADGWVGEFTGSDISELFPSFDEYMATVL